MARVELSEGAASDLARLITTHSLPRDTTERVKLTLRVLERFPLFGAELGDRWAGLRFLLGPWRWMILVYTYFEDEERVVVVSIEDGRSARAPEPR